MRGDPQSDFPSTRWSRILAPGGARDLEVLARAYWRPMRSYLAARLRCRDDEADDQVQEAFAWLLATDLLGKADPARGRFRGFLKAALANFATEQWRRAHAQKRGGGAAIGDLDAVAEPADARARSPDDALDLAWRRELLEAAQVRLQAELEAGGRSVHWSLFRERFLGDGEVPDHATLAARHGITRTDVSNWLDHGKRRYRAILRALVADTVASDAELEDELRWLFGSAPPGGAP
jgi:RNA polymerase sigma-70 factor (ECF subfamily)